MKESNKMIKIVEVWGFWVRVLNALPQKLLANNTILKMMIGIKKKRV